jgi:hypothetical protein
MKTTKFYYVHGYSESEYFTSIVAATRRAKSMRKALKAGGEETGWIYIMEMEIEWPLTKQTMLKVLEGSGYAQNIKKVGCIEW